MKFVNQISVGDVVAIISLLFAIAGGTFGLYQWIMSIRTQRAKYINELTLMIRSDLDIRDIIYLLDYNQTDWYTEDFHCSGDLERKIDKTLSFFSYICYLKESRLINNSDFRFFKYEIERALVNPQVKNYFYNLYHFSNKYHCPITFYFLFEYGEKNHYFEEDFYNDKSTNYDHYLFL